MKLNKNYHHIIAASVALACGMVQTEAQAQSDTSNTSTISIYGLLDTGVRYSNGLGLSSTSSPAPSAASTTALSSGVDRSSRFGFRGQEDLGDGLKAVFTLESELYVNNGTNNPNTGTAKDTNATTANKLFNRQEFVGLAGDFGSILLGRQQSAIRDVIDNIDAVGGRFSSFNPNIQYTTLNSSGLVASAATYYGTGNPGNDSMMRQDNMIKYAGQVGPVTGVVLYSAGGVSGSSGAGSTEGVELRYREGPLALAGAYQVLNNNDDTLKLKAYTAGGRYTWGDWQFAGNYGSNKADRTVATQIKTDIYSIGTTYAATQRLDLTLGYYHVNREWTANSKPDARIKRLIGYAEYKLSKRTLVYLEADYTQWGGDPTQFQAAATNKSTGKATTLGISHTF
jgi:predicted porin